MICKKCNRDLEPSDFYRRINTRCRDCHKKAVRLRALTNPKVQEYERQRAKTPERREQSARFSARWRKEHPEAYRAQNAVNNAVRDGRLEKQACQLCSAADSVHAHHQDYSKPLDVKWLCAKCHHRLHSIFPELGGHYGASA